MPYHHNHGVTGCHVLCPTTLAAAHSPTPPCRRQFSLDAREALGGLPLLWSAEAPHLYTLTLELKGGAAPAEGAGEASGAAAAAVAAAAGEDTAVPLEYESCQVRGEVQTRGLNPGGPVRMI